MLGLAGTASAEPALPAGFELQTVASGFYLPTGMAFAPDGRIFVVEKDGVVKVRKTNGQISTLLDLTAKVNSYSDRGLLGVAVDKNFSSNGWVYLLYTVEHDPLMEDNSGRTVSRLTRITVAANNTVSGGETTIVGKSTANPCPQPHSSTVDCIPADHYWHTVGTVRVDPVDGSLWFGTGDATDAGYFNQAFRTYDENTYAGKVMHVDTQGRGLAGHPFCPGETDLTEVCTKVYAKGFRNPFRFTLRGAGETPVVGDVGLGRWEELDVLQPGESYGWPCYEGTDRNEQYADSPQCITEYAKEGTANAHLGPGFAYRHVGGQGSITGGTVYDGTGYPSSYRGSLFYADYVFGWIRRVTVTSDDRLVNDTLFGEDMGGAVDMQIGPDGNLTYVDILSGSIAKIAYTIGNRNPVANATSDVNSGAAPLTVRFNAGGSTDPDGDALTYEWDFGDGTPGSTDAAPTHTYTSVGNFTARVTVRDGRGGVAIDTIAIASGNTAPTASIDGPATYRDGTSISFSASATDQQDASLPESAFSWQVVLLHNTHTHTISSSQGRNKSFVPLVDHDADSHYEIRLRVTDSGGLTTEVTKAIQPETVQVTVASQPAGASVVFGEATGSAPLTRTAAIGFKPLLSALSSFTSGGHTYVFERWSHGGDRQQTYTVPATDTTITAIYNGSPRANAHIAPTSGNAPLDVQFDGTPSTDPEGHSLTYSWDFGDGTAAATGVRPPLHRYTAPGAYTPTLTVNDGHGGTHTRQLSPVTVGDGPPTATITSLANGSKYRGGVAVPLSGTGSDYGDGTLSGSALTWRVVRRTGSSSADMTVTPSTGASVSFTPSAAFDTDTYYEVTLTARDAGGRTGTDTIRLDPQTVVLTLASTPSGATMTYGSASGASPFVRTAASGHVATIGAASSFVTNGDTYEFVSWSDGGARTHSYSVPASAATVTATYNGLPTAVATADKNFGAAPLTVAFDGTGSRDPDGALTYDWDFGDGTAHSTAAKPVHTYARVGHYTARLTVRDARGETAADTVAIAPGDTPPSAAITSPADGSKFDAGSTITLTGSGSDSHDGAVPGSSLKWKKTLRRGSQSTALPDSTGASASIAVPQDFPADGWYEIVLTAIDSAGLTGTDTLRVDPRLGTIALSSSPDGVPLTWDGAVLQSVSAVVGSDGVVGAPAGHDSGAWLFGSWSDGGAREHDITVPPGGASLLASYTKVVQAPPGDHEPPPASDGGPNPPVTTPPGPGTTPPGEPEPTTPLIDLKLPQGGLRVSSKGVVRVPLANRNALASIGSLKLATVSKMRVGRSRPKQVALGTEAFIVAPSAKRSISFRLSATSRKLLRSVRRLEITVSFSGRDRSGRTGRGSARTVLLAPGR